MRSRELFVMRAGSGPRLLFLGGSSTDFRVKAPVFASPLVSHFDVVSYEPRGLGRSFAPPGDWTMADYADDAAALLDWLGWDTALIVGESFGAMTAAEFALRHPARVGALCLMAAAPGGAGGSSYPIHELLGLPPRERAERSLGIQDRTFAEKLRESLASVAAAIAGRMAQDAAFFKDPRNREGYPRLLKARAGHDVFDRLHQITAPTIVMGGTQDDQAPIKACENMAKRIPNARFIGVKGGHGFAFSSPVPVQTLIEGWAMQKGHLAAEQIKCI